MRSCLARIVPPSGEPPNDFPIRQRAYRELGVITFRLDEIEDEVARRIIKHQAEKLYGEGEARAR